MEKYDRIINLCCSMLDVKNYLLKMNEELTSIGAVFVLDISEVDDSQSILCKTCYHMVLLSKRLRMNCMPEKERVER